MSSSKGISITLLLMIVLISSGCILDSENTDGCGQAVLPAVELWVKDTNTGRGLGCVERGVLRDGDFRERMTCYETEEYDELKGAIHRAGVYDVRLSADGYKPWKVLDVKVTKRPGCTVNRKIFEVELEQI